jgi:hypothetical protein
VTLGKHEAHKVTKRDGDCTKSLFVEDRCDNPADLVAARILTDTTTIVGRQELLAGTQLEYAGSAWALTVSQQSQLFDCDGQD